MSQPTLIELRELLVRSSSLKLAGERSLLYRRVAAGDLVRVARGAYLERERWSALDPRSKYCARVAAAAFVGNERLIFSHHSAALMWRLPWVGPWPEKVHVTTVGAQGGRSGALLFRHTVGVPETTSKTEGVDVTTLARTVVDLTAILPFDSGVVLADAALRRTLHPIAGVPRTMVTPAELEVEFERLPLRHGSSRARQALDFADGRADGPGESLSRVTMCRAGFSSPQLQVVMFGASGKRYVVDFWWPEFNAIGEFDGKAKYSDREFLQGRTPQQALADEKEREDDLRATGKTFARWGWSEATSIPLLTRRLRQAGVR